MTTSTQQIPSNPALDFANAILEETNGGLEIIDMLHDIAQGVRQNSTTRDRINASRILLDRGLGKCPKQSPVDSPNPTPETNDVEPAPYSIRGAIRESPTPETTNKPESPRLVTQLDNALHQSLGPAPSAETPPTHSSLSTNHSPLQSTIQQHILEITNNGRTLMTVLTNICRAPDDDPRACPEQEPALSLSKGRRIKDSHRVTAGRMLIDRLMGMSPTPFTSAVHLEHSPDQAQVEEEPYNKEVWDDIIVKLKALEAKHNLDPNRHIPRLDHSTYMLPDDFDFTPHLEEADQFTAEIELRAERRKKWPEFEEYRRKKLAQTYPSHSEDGKSPDT